MDLDVVVEVDIDIARLAAPDTPSRAAATRKARDVYVYFDNDVKVHAPYDAATLSRQLGLASPLPPRRRTGAARPEPQVRSRMPGLARRPRA